MRVCTTVTESHIPQLRVLAESLLEHHPDARVTAVVTDDDAAGERWRDEPFETVAPAELGLSRGELARLRTIYEPGPLACALKAPMLRTIVAGGEPALHLDVDVLVLGDLSALPALAQRRGVVLTAHTLTPAPVEFERAFARWGTFNAGVLAVGPSGLPFLDWWWQRCGRDGRTEVSADVASDQFWLTLVPTLFDHHVLRDAGVNVSGWSLYDRDVSWDGDQPAVDGGPLRCFHFCGVFDPLRPLDYHPDGGRPWLGTPMAERPGAARVCELYAERLLAAGAGSLPPPARFTTLGDGTPIDRLMRAVYRAELAVAERDHDTEPPTALDDDGSTFVAWLAERPPGSAVSRYLAALRAAREDLVAAFPDVPGKDDDRYLAWVSEATARGETSIPPALLPR